MSCLEVFGVLTGVGVDLSKVFGHGAGVLESASEKCDSAISGDNLIHMKHHLQQRWALDWIRTMTNFV